MTNLRTKFWTLIAVSAVSLLSLPGAALCQPSEIVNVKEFGAKGDGQTDDTQAIRKAADAAAARTLAFQPPGGAYLGSSPPVYFPSGRYKISDEINFGPYASIMSDGQAIVEQTGDCRSFVFVDGYTIAIRGIRFLGGTNQIHYSNANIDTSTISIEKCEFQLSKEFAIYTIGTTDGHLSANLIIDRCKFVLPKQVLHNACDAATVRDCWVSVGDRNFANDSAAFVNRSGVLMFDNMFGVPMFSDRKQHGQVRWIDNHDQLLVNRSRFGGEYAGIPIVHHFGKPSGEYPWMGQTVAIENSQLSAGPSAHPGSGVLTVRDGLPQLIRFVGNRYLIDAPYIRTDGFDVASCLQNTPRSDSRFRIEIESNMDLPSSPEIPEQLKKFVR